MNDLAANLREDLRSTAQSVPALISFFDADHICRLANDHHRLWYGRQPEELVGLHMREFLGAEGYMARLPFLERVARGEQVSFEAPVPHLDGGWREAAIRYVPRIGPGGFEGFHTLVFDLTREQNRFHSVFDGTAVAFWEVDLTDMREMLAEHSDDREELIRKVAADLSIIRRALSITPVLDLNRKASAMFFVDRGSAIGRPLGDWIPDAALPVWNNNLLAYLGGAESYDAETVMRREDGVLVDVLLSCAFPRRPDEQVIVTVGLVDIGERVAKERELARTQDELAHAARIATLGELMASIAHEVNQPLAAVVTNGNSALRWLSRAEPDLDEAKAALSRIISEGRRASEIIARTRQMALKGGEARAVFDVAAMIQEAGEITRRQIQALGASLSIDLDPHVIQFTGDRVQLQQVIINLLVNAAQAMAGQEADREIRVGCTLESDRLSIEVADTGPGISAERHDRIFDAFYTTKAEGMGMGLSIANTIVKSHAGRIEVKQPVGRGTVFRIVLPGS